MTRRGSTVRFVFVDVFASVPLTGNPVSIVPDADDLTEAQMQGIAQEFNQSGPCSCEGTVAIEQGHALGRPSRIQVTIAGTRVTITGSGLLVADGVLHLGRA
jgi:predicted PhzF superfamily epimerase YddE/YHI9